MNKKPEISVIIPCRNEQEALPLCLKNIKKVIKENKISAEIIVSDSSTDKSPEIAKKEKVKLIKHDLEGYGRAYLEAFKIAKGKYIFMADADCTYDFREIPNFLNYLKQGYDLIIGNRLDGNIEEGSMPWANRYIGTPLLSFFIKLFFSIKIRDSQSGMRAIKKDSLKKMNLQTSGMEFASEMIIKAIKKDLKIKEVPIDYYKRLGRSKLKPFSDAYRHIRFMLLYSPFFLFFIPGIAIMTIGVFLMISSYLKSIENFGIASNYIIFLSSLLIITGYQIIIFTAFSKIYSITHLGEKDKKFEKLFQHITLERAILFSLLLVISGVMIFLIIFVRKTIAEINNVNNFNNLILALTLIIFGIQTFFSAFIISILGIKEK